MLASDNPKFGYNAATGNYEDLMAAGIIDPTKVSYYVDLYRGVTTCDLISVEKVSVGSDNCVVGFKNKM